MRHTFLIVLLRIVSFSCAKTLRVDKEPNINTSLFKTYSWNTNNEKKTETYCNQAEIDRQIRLEVDKSLKARLCL